MHLLLDGSASQVWTVGREHPYPFLSATHADLYDLEPEPDVRHMDPLQMYSDVEDLIARWQDPMASTNFGPRLYVNQLKALLDSWVSQGEKS